MIKKQHSKDISADIIWISIIIFFNVWYDALVHIIKSTLGLNRIQMIIWMIFVSHENDCKLYQSSYSWYLWFSTKKKK